MTGLYESLFNGLHFAGYPLHTPNSHTLQSELLAYNEAKGSILFAFYELYHIPVLVFEYISDAEILPYQIREKIYQKDHPLTLEDPFIFLLFDSKRNSFDLWYPTRAEWEQLKKKYPLVFS